MGFKNHGRQGGEDYNNSQDKCLSYLVSLLHMRKVGENVCKILLGKAEN